MLILYNHLSAGLEKHHVAYEYMALQHGMQQHDHISHCDMTAVACTMPEHTACLPHGVERHDIQAAGRANTASGGSPLTAKSAVFVVPFTPEEPMWHNVPALAGQPW